MEAVNCPDVLRAMLARPVDLSAVDPRGYTLMHHALASSEARTEAVRIVREAGFDVARWRASLNKEFRYHTDLAELLDGASASTPGTAPVPTAVVDWTALGPYPARSASEAARLLSRPGADVSVDDHLWDAIARRQPQRLALALQAGATIAQVSRGSRYTPLMTLADSCDGKQPDLQLSLAEQLIAARADTTAVSRNGSNALLMGAARCPIAVLRALIAAGTPVTAVDTTGNTAMKLAILEGRADVVTLLIDAGVDPRKEPYNAGRLASGNTAVQDALRRRPTP